MIIKFKLFEQSQVQDKETLYDFVKKIENGDLEPLDIEKKLGINENEYEIADATDKDYLEIRINESDLEDLMEIEHGIISHFKRVGSSYNNYEAYVDDEEYNYIQKWLEPKTLEKIKKFAKYLDYEIEDIEKEDEINKFLDNFGLVKSVLEDFKWEYASIKERAFSKAVSKIFKEIPIGMDHSYDRWSKKDSDFHIHYDEMFVYMEKNNCKDDIFTIKDLLEYVGRHEGFYYDLEHDCAEFEEGYEKIDEIVSNNIDNLYDSENDIGDDKLWALLVENDNVDLLKEKFDDIDWSCAKGITQFKTWHNYSHGNYYLMQLTTDTTPECIEWFKSKEFQEKFINIDGNIKENFNILDKLDMLNPEIEEEYDYVRSGGDMGLM